jgi:hypothetical protein
MERRPGLMRRGQRERSRIKPAPLSLTGPALRVVCDAPISAVATAREKAADAAVRKDPMS